MWGTFPSPHPIPACLVVLENFDIVSFLHDYHGVDLIFDFGGQRLLCL